jgi:signal transduction histidine kinase
VEEQMPRLTPAVETALFRIAQEALTNVAAVADATQVTMALEQTAGVVRLSIADDGRGFQPAALRRPQDRRGWGLLTMRGRAEAVGAILSVESEPGKGTRVAVEVKG